MDDTQRRAMHDQHSRDEARMRRAQEHLAGGQHSAVQAYAAHGAAPDLPIAAGSAADLAQAYEDALRAEEAAWGAFRSTGEDRFEGPAWDAWRGAVEARDQATRLLINYALGSPA